MRQSRPSDDRSQSQTSKNDRDRDSNRKMEREKANERARLCAQTRFFLTFAFGRRLNVCVCECAHVVCRLFKFVRTVEIDKHLLLKFTYPKGFVDEVGYAIQCGSRTVRALCIELYTLSVSELRYYFFV